MLSHPFFRSFGLVLLAVLLVHLAVAALYLAEPKAFYYRAWEYFFLWANNTREDDSVWERVEYSDLGHRHWLYYQESRYTRVTTDADGYRSVPGDMGPPRILVQGRSNVFGSGSSDRDTLPWRLAETSGVATFNGAHGKLLATLSRPGLEQVELVVDVYHERHLSTGKLARNVYSPGARSLQPYKPLSRNSRSRLETMMLPPVRPGWWLADIVSRFKTRLFRDFKEYRLHGNRSYMTLAYAADDPSIDKVIELMARRRHIVESLGYSYLAVIIPDTQTVHLPPQPSEATIERGTRIAAALEKRRYPLVNLFPEFRSDAGPDYYFPYDTHMNPRGHDRVAELVTAEIARRWPQLLEDSVQADTAQ